MAAPEPILTDAMRERAMISLGDPARLAVVLAKARRGEPICVAAIGGSITAGGSHTKDPSRRYIKQLSNWFETAFPGLKVSFVNAGIGATDSAYGALRVKHDVLDRHPDLVVVEYAVNDTAPPPGHGDSYEGVLRQLLSSSKDLAVIELFFMHKDGKSAQPAQVQLGRHYGLPMISFTDAMWPEFQSGRLKWEAFYDDVVHPSNEGHDVASELLRQFLASSLAKLPSSDQPLPKVASLPAPLISDAYDRCVMFRGEDFKPVTATGWTHSKPNVWECGLAGGTLEYEVPGQSLYLGLRVPTAAAKNIEIAIDGAKPVSLGASPKVASGLPAGLHKVKLIIHPYQASGDAAKDSVQLWWGGAAGSAWAVSPGGQPEEPIQLRGLPKPNELPLAQGPFQPTQASLDELYHCPEWFADAKFGFWAHWGPQSVGMNGWYAKRMYDPTFPVDLYHQHIKKFGHPSKVGYKDTIPLFTADKFDPEGLMAEFKEMGARLFLSMGVHHDNYDMWNSKYHRWNAVKIGPHKDIVGLWQQAAKKQGLRFGVSTHLCPSYDWWNINKSSDKTGPLAGVPYDGMDPANWDLYHPPHPGDQELHAGWGPERNKDPEWWKQHCFRRMYDLVTTYQPDFVNENDGGKSWGDWYDPTLIAHYYNMNAAKHGGVPDVVWYGKEGYGKGTPPCGEFGLPKLGWRYYWEQETSICGWYYEGNPPPRVETLVKTFVEVICRNGIFIISFPQRADGTVPEDHMNCLREMGKWVRLNEDGIFGTRPWRLLGEGPTTLPYERGHSKEPYFKKEDIRFTRKGGVIYAFLMNPADDKVVIRTLGKKARLADGVPQAVRLLGYEGKLNWSQEEDGLKVQLPEAWVGRMIPVIEIRGFAAWDGDIRPGLDGQLVLTANEAQLNGIKLRQILGRDFIENWSDPAEWLSWDKAHLLDAGEYEVSIEGGGMRADVPYRLTIGENELTGKAPAAGGWDKGVVFPAGKITIDKAGVYPVALRAGTNKNWGGLQLFNVTLKRVQ